MSMPAPTAVAMEDSRRYTFRAPASMAASMRARSSTPVTLAGTHTRTRGLNRLKDVMRLMNSLSIRTVMS